MSRDDDDQVLREKKTFDIMCVAADIIFRDFGYEEKGETSGEVATMEKKEVSTCGLINYGLRSTMSFGSRKRQKIESQNPNPDACSPSLCSVESKRPRHVVSNKVVRRKEPDITFRGFGYEEKGETSGEVATMEEKEALTCGLINYCLRSTRSSSSSKRQKIDDESESQNPNHDTSSPRLCQEPVRQRRPGPERGPTPEWLVNLRIRKNGTNEKLIKKRVLTKTDLTSSQTRLLIPWNGISDMDFLNEDELKIIDEHKAKGRETGVDFTLVDSKEQEWDLNIRRWDMTKSSNYALCTGWNNVVASNKFVVGQTLWIWSFRSQDKLYIAFVPLDSAPAPAPTLALPPVPDPAPSLHPAPVVTDDSGQSSSAT